MIETCTAPMRFPGTVTTCPVCLGDIEVNSSRINAKCPNHCGDASREPKTFGSADLLRQARQAEEANL